MVETEKFTSLPSETTQNKFDLQSKYLASIIRGFKIGVTKWMRAHTDIYMVWQRDYYEHIIRGDRPYFKISEYIQQNPLKWLDDKYHA